MEHLELIFIRLLHLLAHHPDFGTTKEELLDSAMYIVSSSMFTSWKLIFLFISYVQFYLDLMATSENISLLYFLSFKGKSVRDSESHAGSEVRWSQSTSSSSCSLIRHVELLCHVWDGANPDQRTRAGTLMVAFNLSGKNTITFRHPQAFTHRGEQWSMEWLLQLVRCFYLKWYFFSFKVSQTTYLPDEAGDWLAERFRTGSSKVMFRFLSLFRQLIFE